MRLVILEKELEDRVADFAYCRLPKPRTQVRKAVLQKFWANSHPQNRQHIKLPRSEDARHEIPRPFADWSSVLLDESLNATLSLGQRQVKCFRLLRSVWKEDEPIQGDNDC